MYRVERLSNQAVWRRWVGCAALLATAMLTPIAEAGKTGPSSGAEGVVNINTASPAQLGLLPGIGAAKARRIVAYRAKRKFKATHELVRVRGIGRRTYRRLKPYLTLTGPTTLARKARPKR